MDGRRSAPADRRDRRSVRNLPGDAAGEYGPGSGWADADAQRSRRFSVLLECLGAQHIKIAGYSGGGRCEQILRVGNGMEQSLLIRESRTVRGGDRGFWSAA